MKAWWGNSNIQIGLHSRPVKVRRLERAAVHLTPAHIVQGHADCLTFMQGFNVPMLVLGGGGYTINNVARCWAYETGRIVGTLFYGRQGRAAIPVGSCWCLACELMKPNMTACIYGWIM